jgi:hypothetical protein
MRSVWPVGSPVTLTALQPAQNACGTWTLAVVAFGGVVSSPFASTIVYVYVNVPLSEAPATVVRAAAGFVGIEPALAASRWLVVAVMVADAPDVRKSWAG